MFKVNNKNTRTTSLTSSSVSIVDFEQVNVSWVVLSNLWVWSVIPIVSKIAKFAISQEWSDVLNKLCHGNNRIYMRIKYLKMIIFT